MLTPLDRLLLDSHMPTLTLLALATMLVLPPMLLPPIPDMLEILDMLDVLVMLVLDTLVLAILDPSWVKLRRKRIADDLISSFDNKIPKHSK